MWYYKTQKGVIFVEKNIGSIIKQARLQKGYTQDALAQLVGVQKSAVAKWENGRVSEIKRSNIGSLSEVLGLDPVLLVSDSDAVNKEKPTVTDDGLSENKRKLIEFAKSVPEDKAEMILQVMRTIVEAD